MNIQGIKTSQLVSPTYYFSPKIGEYAILLY